MQIYSDRPQDSNVKEFKWQRTVSQDFLLQVFFMYHLSQITSNSKRVSSLYVKILKNIPVSRCTNESPWCQWQIDHMCHWHQKQVACPCQQHEMKNCSDGHYNTLKVHKIEIFFGFDFEICIISLLVMSKY
jgi:hypothetical protein